MTDRRRIQRKFLMYYSRVFDLDSRDQMGNLADITPGGAMIVTGRPPTVGRAYRLRLELSDEIADQPFLEFEARCIWCQLDVDPHFYVAGFEFSRIAPDAVSIVERIVAAYGFRDNTSV